MRSPSLIIAAVAAAMVAGTANAADIERFHAVFSGFSETPALLSEGHGTLDLKLDRSAKTLTYTLTFSNLSAPVTQSHIHLGKVHVAGGVMVFFCTNLNNGPAGTPACPANGGTVTGTLTASSVVGPTAQNVTPGDFDAVEDALETNTAYGNIHTTAFPAGELRGEVRPVDQDSN
jgi:hypothetical protein